MIKNFIYLDVEKLHSLSSQIFEGVTEYILNEQKTENENTESQKGPVGSGKILGDILKQSDTISEKKFLNDYSYALFEKKLTDENLVLNFDISTPTDAVFEVIKNNSFIKVKSKAIFNDIAHIQNTLVNFNKIGKALAHVTKHKEISEINEQLDSMIKSGKSKQEIQKIKNNFKNILDLDSLAKATNLQHDQAFLNDLSLLFDYGFQDQLEIQMKLDGAIISANLKRECLREEEKLVIRKYSRHTEVEFVLFGVITQCKRENPPQPEDRDDFNNIKEALMNLVSHLTNLESSFTGRLSNEIIIDPIALYTEL